jgi:hypothetical protein
MLGACNIDASQEPLLQGLLQKWVVLTYKAKHKTYKVRQRYIKIRERQLASL